MPILILLLNKWESFHQGLVKFMSFIKRLSCKDEPQELELHAKYSENSGNLLRSTFGNEFSSSQHETGSSSSMFDMIGYGNIFRDNNNIVKKFSVEEELLHDRFIPIRKASSLKMSCHDEEEENNQNQDEKDKGLTISNIYKKHVLSMNNETCEFGMKTFKNNNSLKYRQSSNAKEESYNKKSIACLEINDDISQTANQKTRKIAKLPAKVLDAPALQDDFYLNLIDWSDQNYLSVGLGSSVYLWSAVTSKVLKLCDLGLNDSVTSVAWSVKGPMLGIGTNSGEVQIWDTVKMKKFKSISGHLNRIGALAWNSNVISSGSRDKTILNRDVRCNTPYVNKFVGHKQQICGLKWSPDEQQLCSGGNDNKIFIWTAQSANYVHKFAQHEAAVKAIAWSPHQHGLLASGGGTADRTIKFWNTLTGTKLQSVDAGSQVCNLMFSKTTNELVSTHGYSLNQINIWKYPKMEKISTLTGHTYRVLYLAMSPDGSTIVTGAGDETLRFWNAFPGVNDKTKKKQPSLLSNNICIR